MEENKQNNKEDILIRGSNELSPGSGSMLADARKKQQRTVEEIATELNLSLSQIRTIELDQSEGLPEPTYVRGYIRSYAKLLGLNPETVLASYKNPNWQKSANLDDMPRGIGSAEMADSDSFFTPAKVISILLIAALGAFLWYSGMLNNLFSQDEATSQVDLAEPIQSNSVESNVAADAEQDLANPSGEVTGEDDGNIAESGAASDNSVQNELVLNFSATSWVDIRDTEDNRLAYKSYTRGEELIIPIESRINVFIGNAEGVEVQYNGEPYDISGFREGVYAKFVMQ